MLKINRPEFTEKVTIATLGFFISNGCFSNFFTINSHFNEKRVYKTLISILNGDYKNTVFTLKSDQSNTLSKNDYIIKGNEDAFKDILEFISYIHLARDCFSKHYTTTDYLRKLLRQDGISTDKFNELCGISNNTITEKELTNIHNYIMASKIFIKFKTETLNHE